jgi:hypothetical protein
MILTRGCPFDGVMLERLVMLGAVALIAFGIGHPSLLIASQFRLGSRCIS